MRIHVVCQYEQLTRDKRASQNKQYPSTLTVYYSISSSGYTPQPQLSKHRRKRFPNSPFHRSALFLLSTVTNWPLFDKTKNFTYNETFSDRWYRTPGETLKFADLKMSLNWALCRKPRRGEDGTLCGTLCVDDFQYITALYFCRGPEKDHITAQLT